MEAHPPDGVPCLGSRYARSFRSATSMQDFEGMLINGRGNKQRTVYLEKKAPRPYVRTLQTVREAWISTCS